MGITRVCQAKDSSELICGQLSNISNLQFWGLKDGSLENEGEASAGRVGAHL